MRSASANENVPAATLAAYSPRLWPATMSGRTPWSSSSRKMATSAASIAGCVISVCLRASSARARASGSAGSTNTRSVSVDPISGSRAASASRNVSRTTSDQPARSAHMFTYCDPWPGKRNATLPSARGPWPYAAPLTFKPRAARRASFPMASATSLRPVRRSAMEVTPKATRCGSACAPAVRMRRAASSRFPSSDAISTAPRAAAARSVGLVPPSVTSSPRTFACDLTSTPVDGRCAGLRDDRGWGSAAA